MHVCDKAIAIHQVIIVISSPEYTFSIFSGVLPLCTYSEGTALRFYLEQLTRTVEAGCMEKEVSCCWCILQFGLILHLYST